MLLYVVFFKDWWLVKTKISSPQKNVWELVFKKKLHLNFKPIIYHLQ